MLRFRGDLQPVMPDVGVHVRLAPVREGENRPRLGFTTPPSPLIMARRTMESAMRSPAATHQTPDFRPGVGVYFEEEDDRHVEIVFPGTYRTGGHSNDHGMRHNHDGNPVATLNPVKTRPLEREYRPKPHEDGLNPLEIPCAQVKSHSRVLAPGIEDKNPVCDVRSGLDAVKEKVVAATTD